MNATDKDVVVFTGSGTTSAIHKLIHAIQLEERQNQKNVSVCHCYWDPVQCVWVGLVVKVGVKLLEKGKVWPKS